MDFTAATLEHRTSSFNATHITPLGEALQPFRHRPRLELGKNLSLSPSQLIDHFGLAGLIQRILRVLKFINVMEAQFD